LELGQRLGVWEVNEMRVQEEAGDWWWLNGSNLAKSCAAVTVRHVSWIYRAHQSVTMKGKMPCIRKILGSLGNINKTLWSQTVIIKFILNAIQKFEILIMFPFSLISLCLGI
jgi:hypothetical protein